ncbi:PREDICTED: probable polygalacturonase At3g15720 [Nelumbo nucifera]|uniref:Probable polygalacturonase At3g15720 n=1 Tax=Nelumbo nucifera TaxID=4432 RepID=A0A1U8Q2R9_NELNU|nr:PREDICTED: probable polygalacturonase At3g15720 [Nelumbo nucifera]
MDASLWMAFNNVNGLSINGSSTIDGRGSDWSPENSPNTDGIHIQSVDNMLIQRTDIGAADFDFLCQTGDDCISIGDYTSNINVKDIICGPGHGISIGSLGKGGTSSKGLFTVFLILGMASFGLSGRFDVMKSSTFNVEDFGAVGDGKTDDSQAFMRAWEAVCGDNSGINHTIHTLVTPAKTFLLKPVEFNGPCKATEIEVQVT